MKGAAALLALATATACTQPEPAPPAPTLPTSPPTSADAGPPSAPTTATAATTPATGAPPPVTAATLPPRTDPPPSAGVSGDVWAALARCESGTRNLRNPPYSGYFQFTAPTWRSMGETGEAADHSYEHQREVAIRLQLRSGWGQWPACSRKLGLR